MNFETNSEKKMNRSYLAKANASTHGPVSHQTNDHAPDMTQINGSYISNKKGRDFR